MPPKKKVDKPEAPYCDCENSSELGHDCSGHSGGASGGTTNDSQEQVFQAIEELIAKIGDMQGSHEDNQDRVGRRLGALETQVQDSSEIASARGFLRPLESFSGKESEDAREFVTRFLQFANFQKWNEERRLTAIPLYLTGNAAVWYNGLTDAQLHDLQSILEGLVEHFDPEANRWLLRQQLDKRVQGTRESISEYAADIKRLCQRLQLPKDECLHCFTRGLKPSIKNYVYLQQPKTLENAEYLARLKSSVSDNEPQVALMSEMGSIVSNLKAMAVSQAKANSVAAFGNFDRPYYDNGNSNNRQRPMTNDRDRPVNRDDLQQIVRELRREIRDTNRRRPNTNNYGRNRRTATGEPICNSCGRAGHISIRCRVRDPRIPNDNFPRRGRLEAQRGPQGRAPPRRDFPAQGN